jgi:hypothetical protein
MLPLEDVQRYLTGAWRMMMGRSDGLHLLDISADGFWTSFFAIVIALPALFAGWVALAGDILARGDVSDGLALVIVKLALIDMCVWILPLVGLVLVGRSIGIGDRIVHSVVSLNWASALTSWIMLPPVIMLGFWPASHDLILLVSLALFGLTIFLLWRVLSAAIGRGGAVAAGVLTGLVLFSLFVQFTMLEMVGLGGS